MARESQHIPLPRGFPRDATDDELATAVRDMVDGWKEKWGSDDIYHVGGEVLLAFLQAGVQEQSRREVEKATRSARLSSRIALGIALVTTAVAVIFGVSNYRGDKSWQDKQSRLLTRIHADLVAVDSHLAAQDETSLTHTQINLLRQIRDELRQQARLARRRP